MKRLACLAVTLLFVAIFRVVYWTHSTTIPARAMSSAAPPAEIAPRLPEAVVESPAEISRPPAVASTDEAKPKIARAKAPRRSLATAPSKAQNATAPGDKEPIADPVARTALGWVGIDPEAEQYWFEAINDPRLSAQERQDLIEDLNEDGLSDAEHPSREDLPLIVNRLALIEEVGGAAMDEVNAAAFEEAYRDLLQLARVAAGEQDL